MDFYRWVRTQWDRAAAIVLVIAGLISLIFGWVGVSGATLPTEQIPYLSSNGLLGIFALGVAATLWLSADLRDEWRKLDDIHRDIRANREARREEVAATSTRNGSSSRSRRTTAQASSRRG
jgi:uncharacterized SAM-binding protein YcdF (DUF218 family)